MRIFLYYSLNFSIDIKTMIKRTHQAIKLILSGLMVLVLCCAFSGCATMRKLSAGEILSRTKLEFQAMTLDSVTINPDLFPKTGIMSGLLPNPHVVSMVQDFARGILEKEIGYASITAQMIATNQGEDTLWVKSLGARLVLDTLMEMPIELKNSVRLNPGENKIDVTTRMPIDRRIFSLMSIEKIRIVGHMDVSLDETGENVPLNFDMTKPVSQEEKQTLMDNARNAVLNSIVNGWVGAIDL